MKFLIIIGMFVAFYSVIKSLFKKSNLLNIKLLISIMFFGGMGFAIGDYYLSSGWATFGAGFGVLVGIELKDKLFEAVEKVYQDLLDERL